MAYTKFRGLWRDKPNFSTPITADALNHIEEGIAEAHRLAEAGGGSGGPVVVTESEPGSGLFAITSGGVPALVETEPGSGLFTIGG